MPGWISLNIPYRSLVATLDDELFFTVIIIYEKIKTIAEIRY